MTGDEIIKDLHFSRDQGIENFLNGRNLYKIKNHEEKVSLFYACKEIR